MEYAFEVVLFQVEYALEAVRKGNVVRKGNAVVGVRGTDVVVLEKKSTAKLQDSSHELGFNGWNKSESVYHGLDCSDVGLAFKPYWWTRHSLIVEVLYHEFDKEEQLAALEQEKKKLKEAGVIGSTMDALGSGVGMVGTGIGARGVGLVGTGAGAGAGVGLVGTDLGTGVAIVGSGFGAVGTGAGVGLVGTDLGTRVAIVGSGFGAVGTGLNKATKFMGRTITGHSGNSRRSGSSTPVNTVQENGGAKLL